MDINPVHLRTANYINVSRSQTFDRLSSRVNIKVDCKLSKDQFDIFPALILQPSDDGKLCNCAMFTRV